MAGVVGSEGQLRLLQKMPFSKIIDYPLICAYREHRGSCVQLFSRTWHKPV